jgi:hypothetical protein
VSDLLPDGAYLAWRYVDSRRDIDRRQVYYDDGRVELREGADVSHAFRFNPEQVQAAKAAVIDSGLPASVDEAGDDVHDAAPLTYAWRVEGEDGSVTNAGYPATKHAAIERLEAALAALEEAAGAWPPMAAE